MYASPVHQSLKHSAAAFEAAQMLIAGGVNSPVRAAKAVGTNPLFIERASGTHLWDVDDNAYVDYVGSWGPMIVGHAHPNVVAAVQAAAALGLSFGAPTTQETRLAQEIHAAYPSMERMRFVSSGTEATMSALRLARGVTGRNLILKFEGCYHGHSDGLLVKAGSGALTGGTPSSAGVPACIAQTTLVARYNDINHVKELFREQGKDIAAIIVEPVAGNMGVVLPKPAFLPTLQGLADEYGSLLIFDEVMTGFRLGYGGAQEFYGITPSLTCLGKIVGGGLPLAVYGGKAEYLEQVAPLGPVYQAGTLAGNPLAVAAGLATLDLLKDPDFYPQLFLRTARLAQGIQSLAAQYEVPLQVAHAGAMLSVFFIDRAVFNLEDACAADAQRFAQFYQAMRTAGINLPPSMFESWFVSSAHTRRDIAFTLEAVERFFAE